MISRPIHAIRLKNALLLASTLKTQAEFAEMIGMSEQSLSQYLKANPIRNIGNNVAHRIEAAFKKEPGWLDISHSGDA